MSSREFDAVVIGAGPSGEVVAGRLSERGWKVALVEDRLVGGECSFWACMPSKALLRPAQALAEVRRVPGAAQAATGELDVAAALRRRDDVIHDLSDDGMLPWLEKREVTLVRGRGQLDGERRVVVGDEVLQARRAVILAVGTTPALPPIDGLAEARPWTNREATTAHDIPPRLTVLGGGPVGCELAQAFATLGSTVTLVEVAPQLVGKEERFAAEAVEAGLVAAGVTVRTGVEIASVRRSGAVVTVVTAAGEEFVSEELLAATGRRSQTEDLGLETVPGLDARPGEPIAVDEELRPAGVDWLYVIGDANGRALLTHVGKHQARVLADRLTGADPGPLPQGAAGRRAPRVTFTEPQVAAVGHTEASAREAGLEVRIGEADAQATAGGSFHGKTTKAPCRIVVDDARDVIVGATFTGSDVAELLHAATTAVVAELPLSVLRHVVPAFPTRSEVWLALLDDAAR